jgi:hypothetical protein
MIPPTWAGRLALALTGIDLELPAADDSAGPLADDSAGALADDSADPLTEADSRGPLPDTDSRGLLAALAERGWPPASICAHAEATWAAGQPWPHPPDAATLSGLDAARWQAALTDLRHRLGLDVIARPPSRRTSLTADERRLMAEVPPHHGT